MLIKRVKTLNKVKIAKPKTITNSAAKNVHTYIYVFHFSVKLLAKNLGIDLPPNVEVNAHFNINTFI